MLGRPSSAAWTWAAVALNWRAGVVDPLKVREKVPFDPRTWTFWVSAPNPSASVVTTGVVLPVPAAVICGTFWSASDPPNWMTKPVPPTGFVAAGETVTSPPTLTCATVTVVFPVEVAERGKTVVESFKLPPNVIVNTFPPGTAVEVTWTEVPVGAVGGTRMAFRAAWTWAAVALYPSGAVVAPL